MIKDNISLYFLFSYFLCFIFYVIWFNLISILENNLQMSKENTPPQPKTKVYTRPIKTSKMGSDLLDSRQQVFMNPNLEEVKRPVIKHQTTVGFERANFELALQNKKATLNKYYKGEQIKFGVDLEHFKIYGPGVYLFFQFLWKLSILFFVLTLISLVPCIYNYVAGTKFEHSYQATQVTIAKFSIGNFDAVDSQTNKVPKLINVISDMAISVCLLVFYFYWTSESNKRTQQIKKTVKLANYNVIQLIQFPKSAKQNDIFKFFSNFGQVNEVAPVQNFAETIELSRQIYELQMRIKENSIENSKQNDPKLLKKIQKDQQKVQKLYKDLEKELKNSNQDVIKYYITFATPEERNDCLKKFKKFQGFCLCCSDIPEEFLLLGKRVEIIPCHNQPGELIWQNCHITWKTRWIRWLVQMFILLLVVAVAFFVISTLNIITPKTTTSSIDTSLYNSISILSETDTTIVQTWCLKNTNTALSGSSALYDLCYDYIKDYYLAIAESFGITFIIILVKFILKHLVIFIAKFQRYKQHTQQSIDITKNLVILYIITTVIIGFLLQACVFTVQFKYLIPSLTKNSYLSSNSNRMESYRDFQNFWYPSIGYQIWLTWVILAFSPHIAMPIYHYVLQWWYQSSAKKEILQKNMQKVMQAQNFQIQDHYANIIMVFMVGVIFCGGMPLMIVLSFIGIITRYIYFKFIFIRFSKVPKTIDEALNQTVLSYFPWMMILHFGVSIWMFGVSNIFKPQHSYFQQQYFSTTNKLFTPITAIMHKLLTTYYYSIFALICLLAIFFKQIIYDFAIAFLFKKKGDEDFTIQFKGEETADNFVVTRSQRGIASSYKIQNNPDYFEILAIKNKIQKKKAQAAEIQLE